jgi:molecular chaperone IbpA
MTRTLTSEQLLRHFIGGDRIALGNTTSSFPPHNIEKLSEDSYILTLAVAGYEPHHIDITHGDGMLKIVGFSPETVTREYVYQGIAMRDWIREFHLGEHIVITGAEMRNGLLSILLDRVVPETLKPKKIEITTPSL